MGEDRRRGRSVRWTALFLVAWAGTGAGCTIAMYPGPKRPDSQTALIKAAGASVQSVDGMPVPVGSAFVVLPGPHTVEAKAGMSSPVTVCFMARARHDYRVDANDGQPVLVDSAEITMRTYWLTGGEACDRVIARAEADRRVAKSRLAAQVAGSAVPPAAASEHPAPLAAGPEAEADAGAPDEAAAEAPPPPAPPAPRAVARSANDDDARVQPAVDPDEPPRRRLRRAPTSRPNLHDDPDEPPPRKPVCGVMLQVGFGGGGADVVDVTYTNGDMNTLSLGDGFDISAGVMCTPVWIGDDLGIGLSATAGYKGWDVGASNGDVSIGRFPLTLALHVMPRVAPRWFLFARGGIDKELGVSISSSGVASGIEGNLNASLGGFGEAGFYNIFLTPEQRGAWSLTFRYTDITYSAGGESASARSFMLMSTFYYNP